MQNVENRLFNSQKSMDPNRTLQELKLQKAQMHPSYFYYPNHTLQELTLLYIK